VAGHDVDGTTNVQQTSTTARHDTSWSFFSLNRSSPAGREGHPQDPAHGETGRLRVHRDGADHHPLSSPDKVSVVPTASCGPAMVQLVTSCLSIGLRVVKNVNISAFLSRAWWGPAHTFIEG